MALDSRQVITIVSSTPAQLLHQQQSMGLLVHGEFGRLEIFLALTVQVILLHLQQTLGLTLLLLDLGLLATLVIILIQAILMLLCQMELPMAWILWELAIQ